MIVFDEPWQVNGWKIVVAGKGGIEIEVESVIGNVIVDVNEAGEHESGNANASVYEAVYLVVSGVGFD